MTIRRETQTILASAARTATNASQIFLAPKSSTSSLFVVDVTAVSATPSIVVKIENRDPLSGNFYNVIQATAITTVSTNPIQVGKEVASSGAAAFWVMQREFRITVVHNDADSITYSIGVTHMVDI